MAISTEGAAQGAPLASMAADFGSPALAAILASLDNSKAEDIVSIDIAAKTPIADYMVVASGRSQRHVGAIADHLTRDLKEAGFGTSAVEGLTACDWVLIDAGDVIVHVFRPDVRSFYNLEKMWGDELSTEGLRQRSR